LSILERAAAHTPTVTLYPSISSQVNDIPSVIDFDRVLRP